MPIAADYPLLEVFWTITLFAVFVVWVWLVVWLLMDNFRRDDHGGLAKAVWTVLVIALPLIGILAYVITRPGELGYRRSDAGGSPYPHDPTDQLQRLSDLKDKGAITDAEFEAYKSDLLA
jgi:predicted membrane channel-forming protein YqfA (hemolysin III family)